MRQTTQKKEKTTRNTEQGRHITRKRQKAYNTYLSKQLDAEVLEHHGPVHQLLLLQQQHKQAALHVPQQVARAVGVHTVVTDNGALLLGEKEQRWWMRGVSL
jgi:hypothetical protein